MKRLSAILALALIPVSAGAEVLQSENLRADLIRRGVSMTSETGDAIKAEQVHVTMRRRDGQPIGAGDLNGYVGFAEKASCKGRPVMVSLILGASDGAGHFEVLCASGG